MVRRNRVLKASYTVEAAFILPIVTLVVILLIAETLFYRDILTAERVAACAAENGHRYTYGDASFGKADWEYSHMQGAGAERLLLRKTARKDRKAIEDYASKKLEDTLWFASAGTISAEINGETVSVEIGVSVANEIRYLFRFFSPGFFNRTVTVTEKGSDIPGTNRILTAAWETGSKTKGFSEFLGKIETLLSKLTR